MNITKKVLPILLICFFIVNAEPTNATEIIETVKLEKDIVDAGVNKNGVLHILVTPDFETNFTSNELLILNPKNNKTQSRDIPKSITSIVFSKKDNLGYLIGEQYISIIEGKRSKAKKRRNIGIGESLRGSVVLDEKNMRLFVAGGFNFSGISVFNSKNLKLLKKIVLNHSVDIFALDEANDRLYISDQDHFISVINTNTLEVIDTIDLIAKGVLADENRVTIINGLAVDGNRSQVYFSLDQGSPQFGYYNLNSDSVTEIPLTLSNEDSPGSINFAYDADTNKIYIQSCQAEDEILIVDGSTQQVSERIKNNSFIMEKVLSLGCGTRFYFSKKDNKIYEIEHGHNNVLILENN